MTAVAAEEELKIPFRRFELSARLSLSSRGRGTVIFATGGLSHQWAEHNRRLAASLSRAGFSTLAVNLLTPEEEAVDRFTRSMRGNIPRLAHRLNRVALWLADRYGALALPVNYFGLHLSSAAIMCAAVRHQDIVGGIVLGSARPDLAGSAVSRLRVPVLFVVGEKDYPLLDITRSTLPSMALPAKLVTLPNEGRLMKNACSLERLISLSNRWFAQSSGRFQKNHGYDKGSPL